MGEGCLDGLLERLEPPGHILADIHPHHSPPDVAKGVQVTDGLSALEHAKRVAAFRNRQVSGVGRGDLQEQPRAGPALVKLPGAVQKARPESDGYGNAQRAAQGRGDPLQDGGVGVTALDVGEQTGIVARLGALEKGRQVAGDIVGAWTWNLRRVGSLRRRPVADGFPGGGGCCASASSEASVGLSALSGGRLPSNTRIDCPSATTSAASRLMSKRTRPMITLNGWSITSWVTRCVSK